MNLFKTIIEISKKITLVNPVTCLISLVSFILFYVVKVFVNEKYAKKLIAPVPIEILVVITGTAISYLADFNGRWNVKIVGPLPLG